MADESDLDPVAFERIIEALNKRGVNYVVIGALGAQLQGVPLPRTADIDVTPAPDLANKKRLAGALQDLKARLRAPGLGEPFEIPLDERTFTGMTTMTFVTSFGPLDICSKRAAGREKDAAHLPMLTEFLRQQSQEGFEED